MVTAQLRYTQTIRSSRDQLKPSRAYVATSHAQGVRAQGWKWRAGFAWVRDLTAQADWIAVDHRSANQSRIVRWEDTASAALDSSAACVGGAMGVCSVYRLQSSKYSSCPSLSFAWRRKAP